MAIEKMKKLRLLAVRDSKEELLKELIRHGCVEFSEAEDALADSEAAALVHPESSELSKLKAWTTPAFPVRSEPRKPSKATMRASSASVPRKAGCVR